MLQYGTWCNFKFSLFNLVTLLNYTVDALTYHFFISPPFNVNQRHLSITKNTFLINWNIPFRVTLSVISCINRNTPYLFLKLFQIALEKNWHDNIPITLQNVRWDSIRIPESILFLLQFLLYLNFSTCVLIGDPNILPLYHFQIYIDIWRGVTVYIPENGSLDLGILFS